MRITSKHSHMNGEEYLLVHKPKLWQEICDAISSVDAEACKTKVLRKQAAPGKKMLYSLMDINRAVNLELRTMGWVSHRNTTPVAHDELLLRQICSESEKGQEKVIGIAGYVPIMSYGQTEFVKEGVAVEVQFGQYPFAAYDLFAKHLSLYISGAIDVGIWVLPVKSLESEMFSGGLCYERELLKIKRQGRGVPTVPLVLVGVAP